MKRILLSSIVAMAMCLAANAQVELRYGPNIDDGYGDASVVTPYVLFPAEFTAPYQSCQITKVMIGLVKPATDVSIYIKHHPKDDDYIYRQRLSSLDAGWNVVTLDTPYLIGEADDVAIGYKATFAQSGGVGFSREPFADADYVYNNSKSQWGSTYGSICIRAVVEGDNLPTDEMLMGQLPNAITPDYDAESVDYTVVVRNVGANTIDGYTLVCRVDGDEALTVGADASVVTNASDTTIVSVPVAALPYGRHSVEISIDQVGGRPDSYAPNNMASGSFTLRDPAFRRHVVCEEGTGTWCGWCPRGMVGMELMKEKYPDTFFPVSIHGGDELEISTDKPYNFRAILDRFQGFPTCQLNRRFSGDPYHDVENLYRLESASESPISLDAQAKWSTDSTQIVVRGSLFASSDIANARYAIAVVLLEDNVTGYAQTNYYHDNTNGYMYGWEQLGQYVTDFAYNDLARGIFPSSDGLPLDATSLVAYEPVDFEVVFDVPAEVKSKANLHIVCEAVNSATGFIDNAAATLIAEADPSGIISASLPAASIAACPQGIAVSCDADAQCLVYNAAGMLVASASCKPGSVTIIDVPRGSLYIVKVGATVTKLKI